MSLVQVGRLGRAHGLAGEVSLEGCSLTAPELSALARFTWRSPEGRTRPLTLEDVRPIHGRMLVRFVGISDRDQASALTRGDLLAEAGSLPDPGPDVAYVFQIVGLEVRTEEGRLLGTVANVLQTGAHPLYVVEGERELFIPATPEVVRRVDLELGVITVSLPSGLEELA